MYIWNEKDFSDMTQVEVEMGCHLLLRMLTLSELLGLMAQFPGIRKLQDQLLQREMLALSI